MISRSRRPVTLTTSLIFGWLATTILFQNCSPPSLAFNKSITTLEAHIVTTEMNTPKEFIMELKHDGNIASPAKLELLNGSGNRISSGLVEVIDVRQRKLRYVPDPGFRGDDRTEIRMVSEHGDESIAEVRFQVGNPIANLQPAMAVRATGCIMCHADVRSSVITDFGFGGDGKGRDYYFGQGLGPAPLNGSIYGDHGENWASAKVNSVIVPKADLPAGLQSSGIVSVRDYLANKFSRSDYETVRSATIAESSRIHIGAPTAAKLISASGLRVGSQTLKFIKEDADSPNFSGLDFDSTSGAYRNSSGELVCEGDLVLDAPVFLKKPVVRTRTGCRIYSTHSVFIEGPLEYVGNDERRNLQISSAKAILLGVGPKACDNSSPPENTPLVSRLRDHWTVPGFTLRDVNGSVATYGQSVLVEAEKFADLEDASCSDAGRAVGFDRLILNAPLIHSRYQGNFNGVIIAEVALFSLNHFSFEFDPVFNSVPILPLLDLKDYLLVE